MYLMKKESSYLCLKVFAHHGMIASNETRQWGNKPSQYHMKSNLFKVKWDKIEYKNITISILFLDVGSDRILNGGIGVEYASCEKIIRS